MPLIVCTCVLCVCIQDVLPQWMLVKVQYKTLKEARRTYFGELQHGTDPAEEADWFFQYHC